MHHMELYPTQPNQSETIRWHKSSTCFTAILPKCIFHRFSTIPFLGRLHHQPPSNQSTQQDEVANVVFLLFLFPSLSHAQIDVFPSGPMVVNEQLQHPHHLHHIHHQH